MQYITLHIRTFEVIITENAIDKSGENMAKILAEKKISTVLISDASIYAVMSRVNKAIIGKLLNAFVRISLCIYHQVLRQLWLMEVH